MSNPAARQILLLDEGWRFHLGDIPSPVPTDKHIAAYMANKAGWARGPAKPNFDDSDWRTVDLPHDWSVEGKVERGNYLDNGFLPRGVGWYRRYFQLDDNDRGKYLAVQFDGVATHCTVYINGHLLHRNWCGYTSFTIDISDVANFGDQLNVIAVFVDATYMEGWWYEGAGIYRHTWLIKDSPLHLAVNGIFVRPERTPTGEWKTHVELIVENTSHEPLRGELEIDVLDPMNWESAGNLIPLDVPPRATQRIHAEVQVSEPLLLWSLDQPNLYTLRVWIGESQCEVRYGYRTIRLDPDQGFFLNDRPVKLLGTCNHQDHAGVGVALPDSIHEFRIHRLKEMGCNAYRCAHNPPAPELLDACDRLGMLVMDENRNFGSSPQHFEQVRAMVLRDRNHPSIFCWSICNEEAIQGTPVAHRITRAMQHYVRELDPSRPVTAAVSGGILNDDSTADAIEIMSLNYQMGYYDPYHAKHPRTPLLASETHCVTSTRGTYQTDAAACHFASYDEDTASWGSSARKVWREVSSRPFVGGLFVWTGFDYRGEPTPSGWPAVNCHFGILDMCGFPKDAFYLHKAFFTRGGEPFVHLLPHWNWPIEGQPIRVMAYTNCDSVELFLNGESLGRKEVDPFEMAEWSVPYRPGRLQAVAFRGGAEVGSAVVETTGPAAALGLEIHASADAKFIPADGEFALPVTVFATDDEGRRVPDADHQASFEISGSAKIIGLGNGDPTCHESAKGSTRSLFHGLAQVIVQTARTPGAITLTASSGGLQSATLDLRATLRQPRRSVAPAAARFFISDWRMSPVTPTRPDPNQELAEQDANSWDRIDPARGPQPVWQNTTGFALYRAVFTTPRLVQTRGGAAVFHAIAGSAEVLLDGSLVGAKGDSASGALRIALPPGSAQPRVLTVLVHAAAAPAGLAGIVEIVPP